MTRDQSRRRKETLSRLDRQLGIAGNPERPAQARRRAARYAASLAEKLGIIERPGRCEWCMRRKFLERHHPAYDRPLHVVYLCRPCHDLADRMDGQSRDGPARAAS